MVFSSFLGRQLIQALNPLRRKTSSQRLGRRFCALVRSVATAFVAFVLLVPIAAQAQLDGHGPDAWQVTGIEPGGVLEFRMGPGEQYLVIGSFAHDARGLEQITCVPYLTYEIFAQLTVRQRELLGPRWCMMHDAHRTVAGWVPQANLMEDVSRPADHALSGVRIRQE